uniref:Uncharacterized protein n=1 Tax=Oryza punctata TaxID=4537 RepID=A0A0E0JG78_ORYPU
MAAAADEEREVRRAVEEKPVVVVGRRGCCMAHVARRLLLGQGANPAVLEVGDDADPGEEAYALWGGGRLVGGLDRLMAMHMAGELVPVLKQAGALWL